RRWRRRQPGRAAARSEKAGGIMLPEAVVRRLLAFLVIPALFAAKLSPTPTVKTGNADVELTATLYVDKPSIEKLLGSDLGGYYGVIAVQLASNNDCKVKVF